MIFPLYFSFSFPNFVVKLFLDEWSLTRYFSQLMSYLILSTFQKRMALLLAISKTKDNLFKISFDIFNYSTLYRVRIIFGNALGENWLYIFGTPERKRRESRKGRFPRRHSRERGGSENKPKAKKGSDTNDMDKKTKRDEGFEGSGVQTSSYRPGGCKNISWHAKASAHGLQSLVLVPHRLSWSIFIVEKKMRELKILFISLFDYQSLLKYKKDNSVCLLYIGYKFLGMQVTRKEI